MPDNRTETIRFRVTPKERERYEWAAGGPRKLSEWLRMAAADKMQPRKGRSIAVPDVPSIVTMIPRGPREQLQADCPHPKSRIIKGQCQACGKAM